MIDFNIQIWNVYQYETMITGFNLTIQTPKSLSQNLDLKFNIVHIQWWGGISQAQLKIANIWIETVQKIEFIKLNLYTQLGIKLFL